MTIKVWAGRLLLAVIATLTGLWLFMAGWFLVARFAPLTYWGRVEVFAPKRNSKIFNWLYLNLFTAPVSWVFPGYEAKVVLPLPKRVVLVEDKNYAGYYNYEGYGRVLGVTEDKLGEIMLIMRLDDGRMGKFNFIQGQSEYYETFKFGAKNFYGFGPRPSDIRRASLIGKWVRLRWLSKSLPYVEVGNEKLDYEIKGEIYGVLAMPQWLRYE